MSWRQEKDLVGNADPPDPLGVAQAYSSHNLNRVRIQIGLRQP